MKLGQHCWFRVTNGAAVSSKVADIAVEVGSHYFVKDHHYGAWWPIRDVITTNMLPMPKRMRDLVDNGCHGYVHIPLHVSRLLKDKP
jgi:hypothetical protein